jgi:hypothetical protein
MILPNTFRAEIAGIEGGGWVNDAFDDHLGRISATWMQQHNADGTHSNVTLALGEATAFAAGVGIWLAPTTARGIANTLGYDLRIGDPAGRGLTWDGSTNALTLSLSALSADTVSISGTLDVGGLVTIGTTANRILYLNPTLGTLSIGQTGNTVAVISINRQINDALMQFGINITPRWDVSGVEATGLRINNTLAAGVAKDNGGGLVVEGVTMGAGSSYGAGGYYCALLRGNHEAVTAGLGTFVHATTLALETSSDVTLWIGQNKNGTTAADGIYFGVSKDTNLYREALSQLTTDGSLRVSSKLSVVGAPQATAAIAIGQAAGIPSSGGLSRVIYNTGQMPAATVTAGAGYVSEPSTAAAAFTLTQYAHLNLTGITIGAGSAVTHQYGLLTAPFSAAANNYGVAIGGASTATLWITHNTDPTTAPFGIFFGNSRDTDLFRNAASSLKTTGAFDAASYNVAGAAGANFSGPVTNITVVNGIVTAAS